jgi:hypothetical protein
MRRNKFDLYTTDNLRHIYASGQRLPGVSQDELVAEIRRRLRWGSRYALILMLLAIAVLALALSSLTRVRALFVLLEPPLAAHVVERPPFPSALPGGAPRRPPIVVLLLDGIDRPAELFRSYLIARIG